ncbi:MAG: PH domain-containing protein [Lachnospiraceae bacterium]|jgi:hypothetical protein|nr:PH domain-containing protein [Lachnospiraceae bacterium]
MQKSAQDDTSRRRHLMFLVGIAFLVAIGWQILTGSRSSVTFHTANDAFTLTGPGGTSATIAYADIKDIKSTDSFDPGTAKGGGTSGSVCYGTWKNDSLGTYTAFVDTDIDTVILVKTNDGTYAFNYEDEDATKELAEALPDFAAQ